MEATSADDPIERLARRFVEEYELLLVSPIARLVCY